MSTRAWALPVSILLHAGLFLALGRVQWTSEPARVERPPAVVWFEVSPPAARETASDDEREAAEAVDGPSAPDDAVVPAADHGLAETQPAAEAQAVLDAPAREPESPPRVEPAERVSRSPTELVPESGEAVAPTEVDWDDVKQQAIASLSERLERELSYVRFASPEPDPLFDSPRGPTDLFDGPRRARRSVLSPGKSRSRFGRWLSELCHTLSGGGFGFFGTSVCAENQARSDLFALIKPDYMKKRPFCWDPGIENPSLLAASNEAGVSTIKCRLVYEDELAALSDLTPFASQTQARQ